MKSLYTAQRMKKKIESIEDLTQFVKDNFDTLTDSQYRDLISATLNVQALWKPSDVATAVNDITLFWERFGEGEDKPFFLNQTTYPFEFTDLLNNLSK